MEVWCERCGVEVCDGGVGWRCGVEVWGGVWDGGVGWRCGMEVEVWGAICICDAINSTKCMCSN